MAGLADTIADNAVYAVLAVVLFALFFLALNGAMEGDGDPPSANASEPGAADGGVNGTADAPNATTNQTVDDADADDGGENATDDDGTTNTTDDGNATATLDVDEVEAHLVEGINLERNASNVSNATWVMNGALQEMAAYHTDDMVTRDYFALTSPGGEDPEDRLESFEPACGGRPLLELVGRANATMSDGDRNASAIGDEILAGWLGDHHDALTAEAVSLIAVAAELDADEDRVYVTMDLC